MFQKKMDASYRTVVSAHDTVRLRHFSSRTRACLSPRTETSPSESAHMGVSGTLVFPLRLATGSQRASSGARPGSGAFSLRCKTVSSSTRNLIWTKGNTTRAARTTTRAVAPNGPSDPDDGDSDKDAMLSLRKVRAFPSNDSRKKESINSAPTSALTTSKKKQKNAGDGWHPM